MLLLKRIALVALSERFSMTRIRLVLMSCFFMVAHKAACRTPSRPSWSPWRYGSGLAGAGDISHTGIAGWRSALWSSFLLWNLLVLQRWFSPLVTSICSVGYSAWLCLGDRWDWLFGSSGIAARCLSWEVWWPRTGSTGLAILQSAKSYCRLSWEQWLHPLHLLGPVLLGCCRLQPTSLSSVIVLQPPLLCEGWGGHPLCLSGNSPVLRDLNWPWDCTTQCSILSIGSVSLVLLRHFPERSWIVVAFPSFTVVKAFTSWYALLLLFFLRVSSVSLHCSPIQFSFALFMHLLMLL